MNLIVDENVDKFVVDALRQDGHNVLYVAEFAKTVVELERFRAKHNLVPEGNLLNLCRP